MSKMIEVGIVWGDGTWSTDYFEIPSDTPQDLIESVAVDKALNQLGNEVLMSDVVHLFMYSIVSEDLEDDTPATIEDFQQFHNHMNGMGE